jgi:hypothetical protein
LNQIQPGSLVYKTDKALNLKGFSKKLRPRFNKLYLVLCVSSTAAYVRLYKQEMNTKKDLLTFEQFLNNPRNEKNKVLPNFQIEKVDLSEIKPVKNLVPLTRESQHFNDNFKFDFPEDREYETHDDQDVPSELLLNSEPDFTDMIPRETNNETFIQEQNDSERIEIDNFIKRPCIKNINKKVSFDQTVKGMTIDGDCTETKLNDKYTLKRQFHLLPCEQNLSNWFH